MVSRIDLFNPDEDEGKQSSPARKTFLVIGDDSVALLVAQELAHRGMASGARAVTVDLEPVGPATKIVISDEKCEVMPDPLANLMRSEDLRPAPPSILGGMHKDKLEPLADQITPYGKQAHRGAAFLRQISRRKRK